MIPLAHECTSASYALKRFRFRPTRLNQMCHLLGDSVEVDNPNYSIRLPPQAYELTSGLTPATLVVTPVI